MLRQEPTTNAPWRRNSPVLKADYRRGLAAPNKGKEYPPIVLTRDEARALFAAVPKRGPRGKRDRALMSCLYRGGMRISEVLALELGDLNRAAGTVRVRHGKGDKARTVVLDPEAWAYVDAWLDERRRLAIGTRRVFCTVVGAGRGRPLSYPTWNETIKRYARRAGIDKHVTSHGLRHTFAFELGVLEGKSLVIVQDQLGHSRLETTARYMRHLAPADRIRILSSRPSWNGGESNGHTGDVVPDIATAIAAAIAAQPAVVESLLALLSAHAVPS